MSDLKLTVTSWGAVMLDKRELTKVMRSAGNDVKTKTSRLINRSQGGGRSYWSAAGSYRASTPGQPPVRVTGNLRSSLKTYVYKTGEGFAVRARQFYSLFLETGAFGGKGGSAKLREHRKLSRTVRRERATRRGERRVMEPRPFLDAVMQQENAEIDRRVRLALSQGLTWKQTK